MQVGHLAYYQERTVYYSGKLVSGSLETRQHYDKLKKTIVISRINGTIFPNISRFLTEFQYCEKEEKISLNGSITIFFIELGRLPENKSLHQMTPLKRYAAYIKYAGDPDKVDKILKKVSEDERLQELELARERFWLDYYSGLSAAEKRGLEEGKIEGLKLGRESGIEALILDNLEEKKPEKEIIDKLLKRFSLSEKNAKLFYDKYAKHSKKL